ncbi:hypothetical protein NDU88_000758 [Pleurodeles waltl]|uniref:Uncharacterized protein n=1 Tax=Pleurodeles waltl TaxID=8319 RepID=A0AAV7S8R4_PLEWA|nr:hypothetical protein NDU88_000758 [Pleurodeles waltl]
MPTLGRRRRHHNKQKAAGKETGCGGDADNGGDADKNGDTEAEEECKKPKGWKEGTRRETTTTEGLDVRRQGTPHLTLRQGD